MSTDEKLKSVRDQVILMDRHQLRLFECPYCDHTTDMLETRCYCCAKAMKAIEGVLDQIEAEELGAMKISIVASKIIEAESRTSAQSDDFMCPYCGKETRIKDGEKYCCKLFHMAVNAIADRRKMERETAKVEKILEKVYKEKPLVTIN